jgi:hypothetical protein
MRKMMTVAVLAAAMGAGLAPTRSEAYAVDCAILLCLAGGWPASAPCAHAKAEFVRRITPWPIEPPLQIWRCPMRAAQGQGDPTVRFADAIEALDGHGARDAALSVAFTALPAGYEEPTPGADADVSGPAFDFVRSIVVYDVNWREYDHENHEGDHTCRRFGQRVRVGTYDHDGAFRWRDAHVTRATSRSWLGFQTRRNGSCAYEGRFRGVAVEWQDHEGWHGYEVVRY